MLCLLMCVHGVAGVFAQERPQVPILRNAIAREAARARLQQQPVARQRRWVVRHPVLFGALLGAGVGAVSAAPRWNELYCATGGDEDCFFHGRAGVLFGAGAGAGVGVLIGHLARK